MKCPKCGIEIFQAGWQDSAKTVPHYFENFHGFAKITHICGVKHEL